MLDRSVDIPFAKGFVGVSMELTPPDGVEHPDDLDQIIEGTFRIAIVDLLDKVIPTLINIPRIVQTVEDSPTIVTSTINTQVLGFSLQAVLNARLEYSFGDENHALIEALLVNHNHRFINRFITELSGEVVAIHSTSLQPNEALLDDVLEPLARLWSASGRASDGLSFADFMRGDRN